MERNIKWNEQTNQRIKHGTEKKNTGEKRSEESTERKKILALSRKTKQIDQDVVEKKPSEAQEREKVRNLKKYKIVYIHSIYTN